jgi:hypothetical protein
VGSAPGPFRLSDVLVAPQIVYNLLSIRQFTVVNFCSVEFDTSGLSVKDLAPRAWYSRFATFLLTLGFVEAKSDTSLFIYHHVDGVAYLLLR